MKLSIKMMIVLLLLIISTSSLARPIIIIVYEESEHARAEMVSRILKDQFIIPDLLISQRVDNIPCNPIKEALLHICITKNQEIRFPVIKRQIIKESFGIFSNKEK